MRQEFLKKLQVAFTVEDDHRDLVTVLWWPHSPHQVLGDDVLEQRRLAAASHSKNNALHHPNLIGPQPGISMNVVSENYPALVPGRRGCPFVTRRTHDERRMDLPFFTPGSTCRTEQS